LHVDRCTQMIFSTVVTMVENSELLKTGGWSQNMKLRLLLVIFVFYNCLLNSMLHRVTKKGQSRDGTSKQKKNTILTWNVGKHYQSKLKEKLLHASIMQPCNWRTFGLFVC
jgi:hypothetical protein